MQVSDENQVKIYNLSAGKSLPEWLSERKRRTLLKKDVDIRRRIELIQDFDMPGVSNTIRVSKDGQYILATGVYKPRVKCFDVNNLSLKFERCYDAEAVTFEILSDDYSKLVFLHCDRYIEFHAAHGRHYRLRIPKFGRDMKYQETTSDLCVVGASSDIYRLNLERGQFLTPYSSSTASAFNKLAVNPVHQLIVVGSEEGRVEAWDPRSKTCVATLDCGLECMKANEQLTTVPSITALTFKNGLEMGVGTATGQILLYDIRSDKPYMIKDHELPVKDIVFHQQDLIYSMDKSLIKIWDKNNGKLYTSIKAIIEFNNLCVVPSTGLMFVATEHTKMQTYYIPSLGPAPRWASFLDSLTEELEESNTEIVYDDYKFVTKQELETLALEHLIGTNLLRSYMHGYFMDVRLYKKAKSVANPFEFDEYRKKKIRETIENERENRVQVNKNLPKVNKDKAMELLDEQNDVKKKKKKPSDLLTDERFKDFFEKPEFEINKNTDEYRLLNPVLSKLEKGKKKKVEPVEQVNEFEELEGKNSSESSSDDEEEADSSDDEHTWTKEVKKQHRIIQREHRAKEMAERKSEKTEPKMFELRQGEEFKGINKMKRRINRTTLGERVQEEGADSVRMLGSIGNREMTFSTCKKPNRRITEQNQRHREDRKRLARPGFKSKHKPVFGRQRK